MAFSPDSGLLIAGAADGNFSIFDASDGADRRSIGRGEPIFAVGFVADAGIEKTRFFSITRRGSVDFRCAPRYADYEAIRCAADEIRARL